MEDHLESVHTLTNRFEADLLMDALEREQIPALLRSFEETPYDGLFVMQRGWGQIMVQARHAQAAREIIEPLVQDLQTKKLYQDPADLDPLLWERLRHADSQAISRNAQVSYDNASRTYLVPILNGEFACLPEEERVFSTVARTDIPESFQLYLVVLHYLLEAQPSGIVGRWVSEQEIPGGNLFFRGPHAFHTGPLVELFGTRPALFTAAAEKLGGMPVASGDLAYRLWALPRVPLLFVLWQGDDEFPAVIHIRFDASIQNQLHTLDTIWALANVVCRSLRSIGKNLLQPETP
jgi:hypothetical protein